MARTSYRKTDMSRAAIYARVSDKSQDAEDKTSISEQISDMEAHCERRGLTIVARYQEVGRGWSKKRPEFQRMLADAQTGTLRHHRLLEVGPPQPGHVPRRRPHGGHRGPPHQHRGRHGRHRLEDLRPHGRRRQDRAGQLPRTVLDGQARLGQAGPDSHRKHPLRLPSRRGRQARGR